MSRDNRNRKHSPRRLEGVSRDADHDSKNPNNSPELTRALKVLCAAAVKVKTQILSDEADKVLAPVRKGINK